MRDNISGNAADAMKYKQIFDPDRIITLQTKSELNIMALTGTIQSGYFYWTVEESKMYLGTSSTNFSLIASYSVLKFITILSEQAAGTTLTPNIASVGNWSISGDAVNFGSTAGVFNVDKTLSIKLNGVEMLKGVDIIYGTSTTLTIAEILDADDIFVILQ